jgi:hypothetical protein
MAGKDFDPSMRPVVLVVLANRSVPTYLYDGSLVMGNLMLAAREQGIGSCWIHRAKENLTPRRVSRSSKTLASKETTRGSVTAFWVMQRGRHPRLRRERKTTSIA